MIPEEDIVVVFTGHVPDGSYYPADYLVTHFILPAVGVDSSVISLPDQWQLPIVVSFFLGGIGIGVMILIAIRYSLDSRAARNPISMSRSEIQKPSYT